jgi:hypothetical protein
VFLKPISILYLASTRIVLSQKCQYAYRPQSKMPVPVSSSVKNASTHIILSQKCQYVYRPQSKMPVRVSSSVKNASTCIVLSRKCVENASTRTSHPVPAQACCAYGYLHVYLMVGHHTCMFLPPRYIRTVRNHGPDGYLSDRIRMWRDKPVDPITL